jgi:Transketolase, C-terminal domain
VRIGKDVSIFCYSRMRYVVMQAVATLEKQGYDPEVPLPPTFVSAAHSLAAHSLAAAHSLGAHSQAFTLWLPFTLRVLTLRLSLSGCSFFGCSLSCCTHSG